MAHHFQKDKVTIMKNKEKLTIELNEVNRELRKLITLAYKNDTAIYNREINELQRRKENIQCNLNQLSMRASNKVDTRSCPTIIGADKAEE